MEATASSQPELLTESSSKPQDERLQIQSLLSEARNTKAMLDSFIGAVRSGQFDGGCMIDLAKGMAFLDAIRNQNLAHIKNLQDRLEVKNV